MISVVNVVEMVITVKNVIMKRFKQPNQVDAGGGGSIVRADPSRSDVFMK